MTAGSHAYLISGPKLSLKFEKRDAWIGVYWNRESLIHYKERALWVDSYLWEIFICVVPFVPLKLSWVTRRKVAVLAVAQDVEPIPAANEV